MTLTKAQSALEYLMIIALALGIIVPITYLFFQYGSESNAEIVDSQVSQIGRSIIDTAETVYFSGEGAKITLDLSMPEDVDDIYILSNRELVFKIAADIGETEAVFFSSIPIAEDGDLTDIAGFGLKKVKIQSDGNQVLIGKFAG